MQFFESCLIFAGEEGNCGIIRVLNSGMNLLQIVPSTDFCLPRLSFSTEEKIDPAERAALLRTAEKQARAELGPAFDFVEMDKKATIEQLIDDPEIQGSLDARIDGVLKRLLFLRGLKSISTASPSVPAFWPLLETLVIPNLIDQNL
jgi:hypothetical protein